MAIPLVQFDSPSTTILARYEVQIIYCCWRTSSWCSVGPGGWVSRPSAPGDSPDSIFDLRESKVWAVPNATADRAYYVIIVYPNPLHKPRPFLYFHSDYCACPEHRAPPLICDFSGSTPCMWPSVDWMMWSLTKRESRVKAELQLRLGTLCRVDSV